MSAKHLVAGQLLLPIGETNSGRTYVMGQREMLMVYSRPIITGLDDA